MISLRIFVIVVFCTLRTNQQTCSVQMNMDIELPNLISPNEQPEENCCDICYKTPGCLAYAWNSYKGGTCWLKGGISNLVPAPAGVNVGILMNKTNSDSTDNKCQFKKNQDISLSDLATVGNQTEINCCGVCLATLGCKAYSWSAYNGGTCRLKAGTGPTIFAKDINVGILEKETPKVKCPPIKPSKDSGYEVVCNFTMENGDDKTMNCVTETFVGVEATYECKPYFKISSGSPSFLNKICQANGIWTNEVNNFSCELDCGIKSTPKTPLVVYGRISTTDQWPWYSAIFRKIDGSFRFICGGSLMQQDIIITASHCVSDGDGIDLDPNLFKVVLGAVSSDLSENYDDPLSQVFRVKQMMPHMQYNPSNFDSDIAVLKLDKQAQITDRVHPVCFPADIAETNEMTKQMLQPGSQGFVVGFGYDETWKVSRNLKELKIPTVDDMQCSQTLKIKHTETQFCAGYTNGDSKDIVNQYKSSACQGDSGGGLYFPSNTSLVRFYVQGIVSFGVLSGQHCDNNKYTVFTQVTSFQSWIANELKGM